MYKFEPGAHYLEHTAPILGFQYGVFGVFLDTNGNMVFRENLNQFGSHENSSKHRTG